MKISNICVYGQDKRMDYVAQKFYHLGYEVYRELEYCDENTVVVLPPPVKLEKYSEIFSYIKSNSIIYGGAVTKDFCDYCNSGSIKIFDYLSWEDVTAYNAFFTAKGIIKEANLARRIDRENKCLVLGYGFCGKAIAKELSKISNVTVMVRKKELKSEIEAKGYSYLNMFEPKTSLHEFDYIFNTVPAPIIDKEFIDSISQNALIYDIASMPGGTDFEYCNEKGIVAGLYLGIPGKVYPMEAGNIIAEAILKHITTI